MGICDQRISYLDKLYSAGLNHLIGALWKGFDNNDASWGSNRVIAQQCGQVLRRRQTRCQSISAAQSANSLCAGRKLGSLRKNHK